MLSFSSIFIEMLPYSFKSSSNICRGFNFYLISFCNEFAYSFYAWAFVPFVTFNFSVVTVIFFLLFLLN